ncbi:MAG: M48 family metallopeptidase [Xanthobacteraceae bacterium]
MPTASTLPGSDVSDHAIAPAAIAAVTFFDGITNRRHVVTLRFGHALEIFEDGQGIASWPYANIRRAEGPADSLRLSCVSTLPLARLEIRDDIIKHEILARSSLKDFQHGSSHHETFRVVAWSLAAIVSIAAVTIVGIPFAAERLAPLIPLSFENRFGEMADNQVKLVFGSKTCSTPAGSAAFAKLVNELKTAGGLDIPLTPEVLDVPIPNAFALPGGRVYLFSSLLSRADNPDELAGVLAHELGHVSHRDHMRLMIQSGGTSFLIGLLFGDITGAGAAIFATRSLLDASYSRDAESQADAFAIATMYRLGRSPKPLGEFLFRITGAQSGRNLGILASHPMTEDRRDIMRSADRPATGPELLTADEWRALKAICRG